VEKLDGMSLSQASIAEIRIIWRWGHVWSLLQVIRRDIRIFSRQSARAVWGHGRTWSLSSLGCGHDGHFLLWLSFHWLTLSLVGRMS
jgi:hypothetical protein